MMKRLVLLVSLMIIGASSPSFAAGDSVKPPKQHWSFEGVFGTYDRGALQRGYKVYSMVCASCHSMDRLYYRDLAALGYSDAQIKNIASNYMVEDGPDDEGEMYDRPALPSDRFVNPYPNTNAAKFANNGAMPPDMSLLVKARAGGADYIMALMTGYGEPPHGEELQPGQYWNKYMTGHVIAMAPPLSDGQVAYEDGTPETVSQYARDVSHFLAWASEPHLEKRKQTGLKVFLFLLVFTCVMYAVKKKIWAQVH
jgi:ubiquinol-cytochrome c reductase cytochrome c1 subunit